MSTDYEADLNFAPPPNFFRTVANSAQLSVLETLYRTTCGRAAKNDISRVSAVTGLEVKWIRKWLSRRRCRSKSRASHESDMSPLDSSQAPRRASVSNAPHDNLFTSAPDSVFPPRPGYMRAISAPTLLTSSAHNGYHQLPHALDAMPGFYNVRRAAGLSHAGIPPTSIAPPYLVPTSEPETHDATLAASTKGFATVPSDNQYATFDTSSTGVGELDRASTPGFLQDLGYMSKHQRQALQPTSMQAAMLSALEIELDGNVFPDAPAALEHHGAEICVPAYDQPCPLFFRVSLEDLEKMAPEARGSASALSAALHLGRAAALPPASEPASERTHVPTPFAEPGVYVVAGAEDEDEEDEDEELPTPTDETPPLALLQPAPRKPMPPLGAGLLSMLDA